MGLKITEMQKDVILLHHYLMTEGERIAITFPMAETYKTLVKQLKDRRWCLTNKWLYVKNTPYNAMNYVYLLYESD